MSRHGYTGNYVPLAILWNTVQLFCLSLLIPHIQKYKLLNVMKEVVPFRPFKLNWIPGADVWNHQTRPMDDGKSPRYFFFSPFNVDKRRCQIWMISSIFAVKRRHKQFISACSFNCYLFFRTVVCFTHRYSETHRGRRRRSIN